MSDLTKKPIDPKTWEEFRKTGLFFFINSILHAFGWVLFVKMEGDKVVECLPGRTSFRGFSEEDQDGEHTKIANYLAEQAVNFPKEIA